MNTALKARVYALVNQSPSVLFDEAFALGLTDFHWDCSPELLVVFDTEAAWIGFRLGWDGALSLHLEGSTRFVVIDACARERAEALIDQINSGAYTDLVEHVRVLLSSERDHDRLTRKLIVPLARHYAESWPC
jgi:hypothetical protein